MRAAAATGALLAAIVMLAAASQLGKAAPSSRLAPGDRLEYVVTVELQQHHVHGSGQNADIVTESAVHGNAVFSIYAIAQDGSALANVALNLTGEDGGQPVAMQTAAPAKVLADGQLRMQAQIGLGVSDAFMAANTIMDELGQHGQLAPGKSWSVSSKTAFIAMTTSRKVLGQVSYRGLLALEVQSVGSGSLLRMADGTPASGAISIGGTTYYDSHDRLFVGEAVRTLTFVPQIGSKAGHDDYSSSYNIVLNLWVHSSPQPAQSIASPPASPTPPQTAASSTPVPPLYSTPYPVPQPSA